MRGPQVISWICFVLTGFGILLAWYYVWVEYRREVNRVRFVWGPDADVPTFNPLDLVNFATMTNYALAGYVLAGVFLSIGLLARFLDRRTARPGKA
jgi:hypothetical protein